MQLGVSAFHATATTINAAVSDLALGIQQLLDGKPFKAGASLIKGATIAPSAIATVRNGAKLMQEYLDPGSYAKFSREAAAVAQSGGRAQQNTIHLKPFDQAMNAWRTGAIGEGLTKLPAAVMDGLARPIMEKYVPNIKMGAFYSMAHDILDNAQRHGWDETKTRAQMQQAWDSIDNRFGQMVYDNLFWHKAFRDTLQVATRSVGWNFGDIRELGGGVFDAVRAAGQAASGRTPDITPRLAFTLALPIVAGLMGGLMTYLMTGERPHTWKDLYYPRRADGTRLSMPTYMKDVFSEATHPVDTALNKLAPIMEMTSEAINNRDFYGTEIRHTDDPAMRQLADFSKWAASQAIPYSFSSGAKLLENAGGDNSIGGILRGIVRHPRSTLGDVVLGQLGFQSAPSYVQNSDALNAAREYGRDNRPPGTKTKDQAEHLKAFDAVVQMYRNRAVDRDQIQRYVKEGKLTPASASKAAMESRQPQILLASRSLSVEQLLNVYEKATPDEKRVLYPMVARKAPQIRDISDPDRRQEVEDAYKRVVGEEREMMAAR
jgi:protein-tyrosine-phosphatase